MKNKENRLESEQLAFIEQLGFYYENYGIPKIGGRILGYILMKDGPVSAEQITGDLTISRASVSTNLRLLLNFGLLEKTLADSTRTDYYIMAKSAWDQAIKARIAGFASLINILDNPSLDPSNSSVKEMKEWCELMVSVHENARSQWKKREKMNEN